MLESVYMVVRCVVICDGAGLYFIYRGGGKREEQLRTTKEKPKLLNAESPMVISMRAQKGWKRVKFQINGCITLPSTGCSWWLWKRAVSE